MGLLPRNHKSFQDSPSPAMLLSTKDLMAFIRTTDCVSDVVIVLANPTEKPVKDGAHRRFPRCLGIQGSSGEWADSGSGASACDSWTYAFQGAAFPSRVAVKYGGAWGRPWCEGSVSDFSLDWFCWDNLTGNRGFYHQI